MKPAFIADLGGVWWVETPDAVVLDRRWLRENFGPHAAGVGGHDRRETPMVGKLHTEEPRHA